MLEEAGGHSLRQNLLSLHTEVSVNVGGHLNIGVTHVFLHVFQCKTVVQQEAGTTVSKLMEPDMRQVVVFQDQRKMSRYIVRRKRLAVGPFENKIIFFIFSSATLPVNSFVSLGLGKNRSCLWR